MAGRIDAVLNAANDELQWKNKIQLAIRDSSVEDLAQLFSPENEWYKPSVIDEPCCGRGTALTPLQFACKEGNAISTRKIIELGADLHKVHESTRTTPLMFAAREGGTQAIDTLLFSNPQRSALEKAEVGGGGVCCLQLNNLLNTSYLSCEWPGIQTH